MGKPNQVTLDPNLSEAEVESEVRRRLGDTIENHEIVIHVRPTFVSASCRDKISLICKTFLSPKKK